MKIAKFLDEHMERRNNLELSSKLKRRLNNHRLGHSYSQLTKVKSSHLILDKIHLIHLINSNCQTRYACRYW